MLLKYQLRYVILLKIYIYTLYTMISSVAEWLLSIRGVAGSNPVSHIFCLDKISDSVTIFYKSSRPTNEYRY